MTMTAVDVNAGFDTERAGQIADIGRFNAEAEAWNKLPEAERVTAAQAKAQAKFDQRIADGKMRDLGNGRYQVTDPGSYDDGEVFFTQRQAGGLRNLLVLPEHGLDTSTGKAALFSMFPEWHGDGEIRVAGEKDIRKVIKLAGLDFTVMQRPACFQVGTRTIQVPGQFVNYRSDNLHPFGVVGKVYTPFQPATSFDFMQGLFEDEELMVASAGAFGLGESIFITALLPDHMVIDAGGISDIIAPYVAILDNFNGSGRFWAMVTPWRIRCRNTERLAVNGAATKWGIRHTTNAPAKVKEAQRTLGLARKYYAAFQAEENALARTPLTKGEFRQAMAEAFGEVAKDEVASTRVWGSRLRDVEDAAQTTRTRLANDRREESLMAWFETFQRELGDTAYAAERALTAHADHDQVRNGSDPEADAQERLAVELQGSVKGLRGADAAAVREQASLARQAAAELRDQVRKVRRLEANLGGDSDNLKDAAHAALIRRAVAKGRLTLTNR
jgi:phage/plasmid-like protein (TIGR03299 family)